MLLFVFQQRLTIVLNRIHVSTEPATLRTQVILALVQMGMKVSTVIQVCKINRQMHRQRKKRTQSMNAHEQMGLKVSTVVQVLK